MNEVVEPMVTVKYTCHRCKTNKRDVEVPARIDPEAMDVASWLNNIVRPAITKDHGSNKPFCSAGLADDIMLPASGHWVGQPGKS